MRYSSLLISVVVAGIGVAVASQQKAAPDPQAAKVEAWKKSLQKALSKDPRAIMIDVDLNRPLADLKKPATGTEQEAILAACMGRVYVEVDGGAVGFCRPLDSLYYAEANFNRQILDILMSLDPATLGELSKGKALQDLPLQAQTAFAQIATDLHPSMTNQLVEGGDYQVSLEAAPLIQFVDPKDGLRHTLPVPSKANPMKGQQTEVQPSKTVRQRPVGFPNAVPGTLDFGAGEVLSLGQALTKAAKAFRINYTYDRRMAGSALFIKGSWTQASFSSTLARLYKVEPPKEKEGNVKGSDALRGLFAGPLAELLDADLWSGSGDYPSAKDLQSGKESSYGDLTKQFPRWAQYLDRTALTPDTRVTMGLGLQINVRGSGFISLDNASAGSETGSLPVIARNEASFILVP